MNRRRFLALSATVAASMATTACASGADAAALANPDLLSALGPDAVRRVGQRYRENVPRERDAPALEAAIGDSRPWAARLSHSTLTDQVRDDFEAGRTVVVDGWLLSVTEARQCALYSTRS